MRGSLRIETRAHPGAAVATGVAVGSVAGALLLGAVLLGVTGHSPGAVYLRMLRAAFGTSRNVSETLVSATPLLLTGAAAAVAFKMRMWNIGAEGQLYLGAILGAGLAIGVGEGLPAALTVALVMGAGVAGGLLWAALAAIPRAWLGTNEIITTLMLNFVALHLMNFLVFGSPTPWRDPTATNFPQGRPIPADAVLPALWGRMHVGFLVALAVAVILWWALRSTRWGFEVRLVGDSPEAARYAGVSIRRKIVGVLCLSGALAGLAGAVQVSGVVFALEPRALAVNLGFTGIIVAALARLDPLGLIPVAILIGALNNTGSALQTARVPIAIVLMLQGVILLFAVAGEWLLTHRVGLVRGRSPASEVEAA